MRPWKKQDLGGSMTDPAASMLRLKKWMIERLQGFVDDRVIPDRTPETLEMLRSHGFELDAAMFMKDVPGAPGRSRR